VHGRDLGLVLEPGAAALGVALHDRSVLDTDLPGHEVQHRGRHVQRVRKERAQRPDRHQLQRKPQPRMITTTLPDQLQVRIVEEPPPLQLHPRRCWPEPGIRAGLLISQELHRHRGNLPTRV